MFLKSGVVKAKCATEEKTELQSKVGCFLQEAEPCLPITTPWTVLSHKQLNNKV